MFVLARTNAGYVDIRSRQSGVMDHGFLVRLQGAESIPQFRLRYAEVAKRCSEGRRQQSSAPEELDGGKEIKGPLAGQTI